MNNSSILYQCVSQQPFPLRSSHCPVGHCHTFIKHQHSFLFNVVNFSRGLTISTCHYLKHKCYSQFQVFNFAFFLVFKQLYLYWGESQISLKAYIKISSYFKFSTTQILSSFVSGNCLLIAIQTSMYISDIKIFSLISYKVI